MKRLTQLLATLLAVVAVSAALAADAPAPAPAADKGPHGPGVMPLLPPRVEKDLGLTADQQTKLTTIKADYEKERDAWTAAHPVDPKLREELRTAREAKDTAKVKELSDKMHETYKPLMDLRKKYVDEVRAILTDDQKTKLDEAIADAKHRAGGRRNGAKAAGDTPASK